MAKGTKVSEKEKRQMLELYQELGTFKAVAKKLNRSPDTVSRYVHEYEAVMRITNAILT